MGLNIENFKRVIDDWVESDEGKTYFARENEINELLQKRYLRFEKWLETNDFDKLLYSLILRHGDDYQDKCYHNGYMPMPNNVLSFIIDYIVHNYDAITVTEIESDFSDGVWFFKGYYFQMILGQGTITRIYNKSDMRLILQV